MSAKPFTEEQLSILANHPYVAKVTSCSLTMTYEFKQLFMEETVKQGMTSRKIFAKVGLDADIIGESRIKTIGKRIRQEAASPEGLRPVKTVSEEEKYNAFAKRDMEKATARNLKAMQEKISELEQEIYFLKKLSALCFENSRKEGEPTGPADSDTS